MVESHGAIGQTEADKFNYPGGYFVEEIRIYPHDEDFNNLSLGIDIRDLVADFSIVESIYSFGLQAEFRIIDGVNLFEKLNLSGNEKIKIIIKRKDPFQDLSWVELNFVVAEYPLFGKSPNKKSQAYKIIAVSNHVFLNNLLSLSKSLNGSPIKLIKDILVKDLGYDEENITSKSNSKNLYKFIIPNITPFEAMRHILKNSSDSQNSAIYAWETIQGFFIDGLSDIYKQDTYKERTYRLSANNNAQIKNDKDKYYISQLETILEFTSNLKLSKMQEMSDGAYASQSYKYDLSTKSYETISYNYPSKKDDTPKLSPHLTLSNNFTINGKVLSDYKESAEFVSYIATKSSENDLLGDKNYIHAGIKEATLGLQDTITHDIELFGDLEFRSGIIINLDIPNADYLKQEKDNHFSGKYLVCSVTHNFTTEYKMSVKIKKDGIEKDINEFV